MKIQRQLKKIRQLRRQGNYMRLKRALQRSYSRSSGTLFLAQWHYEQARLFLFSQRTADAIRAFRYALYFNKRHVDAWYQLGLIYEKQFDFYLSLEAFSKCLQIRPDRASPRLYLRLARALDHLKLESSALPLYLKALEEESVDPSVYFYLAQALDKMGNMDAAIDCLISIGKQYPSKLDLISFLMGYLLERRGYYAMACRCYDEAIAHHPHQVFWQLKRALTYPLVMKNAEEITHYRVTMEKALTDFVERLEHQPIRLARNVLFLFSALHSNSAYVSYHQGSVLNFRLQMAQLAERLLIQPEAYTQKSTSLDRFHLGIMVAPKSITLGFVYAAALAAQLDPQRFEVTLFCNSPDVSLLFQPDSRYHFSADQKHVNWKLIAQDVYAAARQIRRSQLDAMFFTEPSWDFQQYVLALFRVASVQFTSWMNPGSTGLDTMDYFYSCTLMESSQGQENYSETLIAEAEFPSYIPGFNFPEPVPRSHFGLESQWHIYGCLQNLLKIHPDFDALIAQILRRDPLGHLVLVSGKNQKIAEALTQRFKEKMPDVMPRIWIFPELSNQDFLHLLQQVDVMLDPLHYGGGTTTYQGLAWGASLVTLPTSQMVGQITAALCQRMNYHEAIVSSKDGYVERALMLAQDPEKRRHIQVHLRQQKEVIFENPDAVKQFEQFLLNTLDPD